MSGTPERPDTDALFAEASEARARGDYAMRSCHKCNAAHEHLTNAPDGPLIVCFACGRWYFKGVDLSEIAEQEAQP